jgi:hypothetical protein
MGEVFLFCSVRAFVHKRGKEDHGHGHGTGTTRRARAELELELIQTQMTQKPMLRAEVYARALRASQNRKEDSV